jgi:Tc5 transposase DNA-binding domain
MESTKNARIEAAMAMLDSQSTLNYAEAARAFDIHPTTLARRYRGQTGSREEANLNYRQCLNSTQEDTLLGYIDSLTDRHIPATSQIIKNLAEEIIQRPVGKNWTSEFIKRHSKRICSIYLRPLDRARVSAESVTMFERFYALVLRCFGVLKALY